MAQELPTAEIAGGRVWHHRASTECGRWQTHAGGRPRARRTWEMLEKHASKVPLVSSRPLWSAAQLDKRHRELRSNSSATAGAQKPCHVRSGPSVPSLTSVPRGGGRSAGPVDLHRWWNRLPRRERLSPAEPTCVPLVAAALMRCITPPNTGCGPHHGHFVLPEELRRRLKQQLARQAEGKIHRKRRASRRELRFPQRCCWRGHRPPANGTIPRA